MRSMHPGFKAVAASIAHKQGIPEDRADAILASKSRHASKKAKKKNPRLKRVGGGMNDHDEDDME